MLFHIEHVHTEATCPYDDAERFAATLGRVLPSFEKAGARVVGAYVDPPAHTLFFVVDASSHDQIQAGLHPIVTLGRAAIRPVTELSALVAAKAERT